VRASNGRAVSGIAPPATTPDDAFFDELHRFEFAHLAERGESYLDYAGAALYGASQIRAHDEMLRTRLFGNPHSEHGPSRAATEAIDAMRRRVLAWFGVDAATHIVVFTANASAAIRVVAEAYPFGPERAFILAADNHNSVNGVREFARRAGAAVHTLPLDAELRLAEPGARLAELARGGSGLVAIPAQSNFSGVRHPLELVELARHLGFETLLDAAAYVPTSRLDLVRCPADFVALSFYKMFGFPTGIGALVARREALERLERPWFAGGTVLYAASGAERHRLKGGAERFEDGTPNFLGIAALEAGFALLERVGSERLARRLARLTAELLDGLAALRHGDGFPLVRIHGPRGAAARGATVAFSLLDRDGATIPYESVELRASEAGVCLRGGCFCNPGAAEAAFALEPAAVASCLDALGGDFAPACFRECLGAPVGALRASLGIATRRSDLRRALEVISLWASWASPPISRLVSKSGRPVLSSPAGTSTYAPSLR